MISKKKKAELERKAEQEHAARMKKLRASAKRHGLLFNGSRFVAPASKVTRAEYKGPDLYRRETEYVPSFAGRTEEVGKRETLKYTGTLIKGIATMHKSNAVPVIDDDHAKELARMRRG